MTTRLIPISDLAAYAADPDGFVERRGRAANEAAARHGKAFHEGFARKPPKGPGCARQALLAALVLLLVLLVASALR